MRMNSANITSNECLVDGAKVLEFQSVPGQQNNMEIDLGCLMDALSYVDHAPDERKTTEQPEKDCKRKSLEFLSGGHDDCGELEEHATLYCPKRSSIVSAITTFSMESLDLEDSFISRNNSIDIIEEGSAVVLSTAFSTQTTSNTSGLSSAPRRPNRRGSMEMGSGLHHQYPSGGLRRPNRRGSIDTGGSGTSDISFGIRKPGRRGSMDSGCRGSIGSGQRLMGVPRKPGRRGSMDSGLRFQNQATLAETLSIGLRKPRRKGSMSTDTDVSHYSEISDITHDIHSINESTEYVFQEEIKSVSTPIHPITESTEYVYMENEIKGSYSSSHVAEPSKTDVEQSIVEQSAVDVEPSNVNGVEASEKAEQPLQMMENPILPPPKQLLPPPKNLPCKPPRLPNRQVTTEK